jgi:hypothetical protein
MVYKRGGAEMQRVTVSAGRVVLYALGLFAVIIVLLLVLQQFAPSITSRLATLSNIAGVATLLAVILAFFEYRRQLVFDRTERAVEFMLQFYNNDRLDLFRKSMRNWDDTFSAFENDSEGSLKDMVVLGMNYLEALAIAVHEGVFHPALVERMLGTVIMEVANHPMSNELRNKRFSYENFYELLVPKIEAERKKLANI